VTPTQRILARLRQVGYVAAVVERWNAHAGIRQDLFGCIDLLAVRSGEPGVLGIQATTRSNQSKRQVKAIARPELRAWLEAGNRFEIWGWAKVGPHGKRKLWDVTRTAVAIEDLVD
jgi:hypothetical protein